MADYFFKIVHLGIHQLFSLLRRTTHQSQTRAWAGSSAAFDSDCPLMHRTATKRFPLNDNALIFPPALLPFDTIPLQLWRIPRFE